MKSEAERAEPHSTITNVVTGEIPSILMDKLGIDLLTARQTEKILLPVIQDRQLTSGEHKEVRYVQQTPEGEVFSIEFFIIYRNYLLITGAPLCVHYAKLKKRISGV